MNSYEEILKTPQNNILMSKNHNYMKLIVNYLNDYGEELDSGLSPYGLVCSYIDFEFSRSIQEQVSTIIESLQYDPTLDYLNNKFSDSVKDVKLINIVKTLMPTQICALITFIANFGSPVSGLMHILVDDFIPDGLIRARCDTYKHVSQFDDNHTKEAALQGAFINQNSIISFAPDEELINRCRKCCFKKTPLDEKCFMKKRLSWLKEFASCDYF